jgi:hypothetical protein
MTQATHKEIIEQAKYIVLLAKKIEAAAMEAQKHKWANRASGTITNLAPELAKAASQIKQMNSWGWSN